jgi:hypothetical protein
MVVPPCVVVVGCVQDPHTGDPNLLKFMALGRLAKGSSGGAISQSCATG